MKHKDWTDRPSAEQLRNELSRLQRCSKWYSVVRQTLCIFLILATVAVLVLNLWLPILQVNGTSMEPTLADGEIVWCRKTGQFQKGDVIAFYYQDKVLIKRVIAGPGQSVNILEDGTVFVDQVKIREPYVTKAALGYCDRQFPYRVPEGQYFVMGDDRVDSTDSRSIGFGCVSTEYIIGKVELRLWPKADFGWIS